MSLFNTNKLYALKICMRGLNKVFDDLLKEIKVQLYDRVKSPLMGGFLVAWSFWNWKILLALFSDLAYPDKAHEISNLVYQTGFCFFKFWGLPLISALAYIYIYPFVAKFPYEYSAKRKKELKEIQRKIEDATPITQEEANRLRRVNQEQLSKIQTEMEELQSRYQVLADRNRELENKAILESKRLPKMEKTKDEISFSDSQKKNPRNFVEKLPPKTLQALKALSKINDERVLNVYLALVNIGGSSTSYNLSTRNGINKVEIDHSLSKLGDADLVETYPGGYSLTEKGSSIAFDLALTLFSNS